MGMELALERVKTYLGVKNDKDIAKLLGITANDFSNRKRRGTLLPVILEWATNENVSLDFIVYGDKKKTTLSPEHQRLVNAYDAAEKSIQNAALTILENSATQTKNQG